MAQERIGYEDFFDKELFKPVVNSIKELLSALDELEKAFKEDAKKAIDGVVQALSQVKTASDVSATALRETAKAVSQVDKAQKALQELQKEKEKLQLRLDKLNLALSQTGKEYIRLQAEIKKAKNEIKDLVKAEELRLKFQDAQEKANRRVFADYRELSEVLETLRARVKDLAAAGQENTDEFRELSKTVLELDERVKAIDASFGQFQRLVGSYRESIIQAFSDIGAAAIGVQGNFGKFSLLLIEVISNAYKAQGGIKGLSSAISILGKSLKATGIILLLDVLVSTLSLLRKVLFPTGEEQLYTNILKLQNELISERIILYERILEEQSKIADLEGDDLTTTIERLRIQQKIVELQLIELEAQKNNLEVEISLREEMLKSTDVVKEQLGIIGSILNIYSKAAQFVLSLFSDDLAISAKQRIDDLAKFLAQYIGDQSVILEKEKELKEAIEKKLSIEEQILNTQNEYKRIQREILDIQTNALNRALEKLLQVEERATTQAEEIVLRHKKLADDLEKSFQESIRLLGAGFEKERKAIEDEFRRRQDILKANFGLELAEASQTYINQAAQIIQQTLPAVNGYVQLATELIVQEQARTIDSLINELKSFIDVLEAEAALGKENADVLLEQSKNARALVEALQKVRQTYQLNALAELIQKDIQAFRERERVIDAQNKKVLALLQQERQARLGELQDRELLLEKEKLAAEERFLFDTLFLRNRRINQRALLEAERQSQEERIQLEKEFEEARIRLERENTERRLAALQDYLNKLRAEAAKFQEDTIPAQLKKAIFDLETEIETLQASLIDLNTRAAEVAANAVRRTTELSIQQAKKQAEIVRQEAQDIIQATEQILTNINKLVERRVDSRIKGLETEKDTIEKTIDVLVSRAEAGSLAADQSISELLERKKQIEIQEQEIRRQQQRREMLLTALQAYSAAIQRGSQSPLVDTIRDLTAISQLIQALPTFYEGTEYVSTKNAPKLPNVARDAFLARLHEGERIVPANINTKLKGIKNEDLPKLVHKKTEISFDFDAFRNAIVTILRENNIKNRYIDRL